jgi:hypothetical protein
MSTRVLSLGLLNGILPLALAACESHAIATRSRRDARAVLA